jgi:ribokinase
MSAVAGRIVVLGVFVADVAFRTPRMPAWGETLIGSGFALGPGGKGSNQAVAAARLGGAVSFVSRLGRDAFGDMARATYAAEGIDTTHLLETDAQPTGAAAIIIDAQRGENAIIIYPGACGAMTEADVEAARPAIAAAAVFVTNLELPVPVVMRGLALARACGVRTVLNPAPAIPVPPEMFPLCDYVTPNEHEAQGLTGEADPERAAHALLALGTGCAVVTLGEAGAMIVRPDAPTERVPVTRAGPVVETTGAGDAFNGGFVVALAEGRDVLAACRFASAVAGISVTRAGTAPSMPRRAEVEALLARA